MTLNQILRVFVILTCIQCTYNQAQPKDPSQLDPSKFPGDNKVGDRTDLANQNNAQSGQLQFYMDSTSDCSPVVRETGDKDILVYGRGSTQSGASPLSCELSLRVNQPRDPKRYKVSLLEMDIRECDVRFYIYDGSRSHSMLGSYGCPQNSDTNYKRVLWTSGNQVTFFIERKSREQTAYSIRINIQTIRSDTNWENWPQNPEYNRFYKFEQKWVVLIVGLCYVAITLMMCLLLAICYCCIKGDGDKWQKSRFGIVNPVMTASGTKSTINNTKPVSTSKPYTNGTANGQFQRNGSLRRTPVSVKKRMAGGSEDIDSVFESDGTMANKRMPQKNYGPRHQVQPYKEVRQRNGKSRGNFARDTDESYVQADDDHPQDLFIQREIIIPSKKKAMRKREEDEFSSEDEELSSGGEEIEKVSSAMNTDPEMKDGGVQYSEPEESDEEDEAESEGAESEPEQSVVYAKPQKNTAPQTPRWENQVPVTQPVVTPTAATHARPRTPLGEMDQYIPQHPTKGQRQPIMQQLDYQQPDYRQPEYRQPEYRQQDYPGSQAAPYGYYPSEVPSHPSQQEYYPNMAPPPYQTSSRYPRYTPEPYYPSYEDNQYHPRPGGRREPQGYPPPNNAPRDPPIYSYLVRRGYNPVDGHHSPVSSNNSLENRLGAMEESDVSANLDSGVEIMRR